MTLVEVLVALLVLSIGLLGIAALQTTGLTATRTAGARTQATLMAYDIIDRMRANRRDAVLAAGSPYVTALADTYTDPATAPPGTPGDDLIAWKADLAALLPDGRGAIVQDAADPAVVTVTIQWVDRDENRAAGAQALQFTTMTRL